jgi:hypothetical protein
MSYIFISYSHEDKEYAHRLEKKLKPKGFEVWLDDRINYGSQWPDEIEKRLDGCKALILIMTPRSKRSEWVQNELNRAKRKKKNIFPLLLEGDEPWLSVEATQYVDVRNGILPPEDFYDSLARVVPKKKAPPTTTIKKTPKTTTKSPREQKIDEIVKELNNLHLKTTNALPSPSYEEDLYLRVGECRVSYFFSENRYFANLYFRGFKPQSELIQELINLGWKEAHPAVLNLGPALVPVMAEKDRIRASLTKNWKKDIDLVAIAKFLIDTNDLFSIKPSEIEVKLQKRKFDL